MKATSQEMDMHRLAPTVNSNEMIGVYDFEIGDFTLCGGEWREIVHLERMGQGMIWIIMRDGTEWTASKSALRHVKKGGW